MEYHLPGVGLIDHITPAHVPDRGYRTEADEGIASLDIVVYKWEKERDKPTRRRLPLQPGIPVQRPQDTPEEPGRGETIIPPGGNTSPTYF